MAWQLVNSFFRFRDGTVTGGFLVGSGKESNYYCFANSPYVSSYDGPFISDKFLPTLKVNNGEMNLTGLEYGQNDLWSGDYNYIFYSGAERSWIRMSYLREPYYYTDIDGTTKVGDKFFKGAIPDLNGEAETWEIGGAYTTAEENDTIEVTLEQNLWLWHDNGDQSKSRSYLAGRYYNSKDGSWKFVGIPTYKTQVQNNNVYVRNETFQRSATKVNRFWVYTGSAGHTIAYDTRNQKWVMGTVNTNTWSEGTGEPSMTSDVTFTGYKMEDGNPVSDPLGDFTLAFAHYEMGNEKKNVLMGEISIWRPA